MNILVAASTSIMSSGATLCLIDMVNLLKVNGQNVIVILPSKGELEVKLKELGVKYYIVHEYHAWYTSPLHQNNNFKVKRLLNYYSILRVIQLIKKESIDIVHINALTAYTVAKAAIVTKRKLVWHMREFMDEDLGISFYDLEFTKKLVNKSDALIAISKAVRDKWSNVFDAPISVIADGLPINSFYIPFSEKQVMNHTINVLIYGRIVRGKGQLFFFQGAESLLKKHPNISNVHFYWAGKIEDKSYYKEISTFIETSTLIKDKVTYLGEVTDIKKLLIDKHIVSVCSSKEAFGRVTVEAMLAGCLVIGADSGGTSSILNDQNYGFLYTPDYLESYVEKKLYNCIIKYPEYQSKL